MLKKLKPDFIYNNIFEIEPEVFIKNNINAIIFDIDDTLVANDIKEPTDDVIKYFDMLKENIPE